MSPERREAALKLHRAGQLDAARAAYGALLEAAPQDTDLLGLLGVVAIQQGRTREAEETLRRSLALGGDARIHLRNLNNLVFLLTEAGRRAEVPELLAGELPEWPEDAPATGSEYGTALSLTKALIGCGQLDKARRLLDRAVPERRDDGAALNLDGQLRLEEGDLAGAIEALTRAAELTPENSAPLITLSRALDRAGQREAAKATVRRVARGWPLYRASRRPSQRATVMVLNQAPSAVDIRTDELGNLHFYTNYPSRFAMLLQNEYRFLSLFGDLPPEDLPEALPDCNVVLNNLVNSEAMSLPGRLDAARALVERIGRPVINHPDAVFETTRQKNALLLQGVPNLKVPQIMRYRPVDTPIERIVADIDERFAYPVIVRNVGGHMSSDVSLEGGKEVAVRITTKADLHDHLQRSGWPEVYAIEFVNLRKAEGWYRKLRAAVVGDEAIIMSGGIFSHWMTSGWRSKKPGIDFYRANPEAFRQVYAFLSDPERELGAACYETLRHIRDRIPLDVFGVDFDVDDTGQLVFFEATASMTFPHPTARAPRDLWTPTEPFERVLAALQELMDRRIAEGGRPAA